MRPWPRRPIPFVLCVLLSGSPGAGRESLVAAPERVRADVARLAADDWQGRRAGTEGAEKAAEWLAGQFKTIGLLPAGSEGGYFQPFTFIDGVVPGPANRLSVSPAPAAGGFEPGEDFRPLAFSAPGEAAGEVVFAGYGIVAKDLEYDDYAGVDVLDKVVLVLRYGPEGDTPHSKWAPFMTLRQKASTARDRGAKALLIVTGPRTKDAKDELVPLQADASLADAGLPAFTVKQAVAAALFAGSGTSLDDAQKRLEETGRPAPLALPGARVALRADVSTKRAATRNVLGLVRGLSPEAVVVGAHYDHLGLGQSGSLDPSPDGKIHHGADDNASGVAGLLELARRSARRPERPSRTLVFVGFGAEELGTLGSSYLVKNPTPAVATVAAMVNLDMIGRLRDDVLDVHGVGTSPVWKPLLEEANKSAGLKLRIHEGGYGPSDHSPFYAAGKPVFFVFTGNHAEYHRPSDTVETINADGIVKVMGLVEAVVNGVVGAPEPVAFTRVAADKEEQASASRGFRVWVGGIPDYGEEGVGVKFSGVSAGSPAEQAGIRKGDVLVRFGGKEIRNIYDYTYALGERKPGDKVTVVVKREGAEVSLELSLAARPSASR
jgi:Peptidase family M28/PDZ domain